MWKLSLNLDVFVSNLSGDLLHSFYHTYTIREVGALFGVENECR